jgi:peroxiredoxin
MAMQSAMLALSTAAPPFRLTDTASGKTVALEDFAASRALLVAFICNHCPYVKHILDGFVAFAREYGPRGLAVAAISSNDITTHPADSPGEMAKLAREKNFSFPYLYDESQAVARAYDAACTPDFFLFDGDRRLVYRGQFDGSRPGGRQPVTGADMRAAVDALLAGSPISATQIPSVGCGIKWKAA